MNFDGHMPGKIIFGSGRVRELPENVIKMGKKAFIATSFNEDFEVLRSIIKLLESNNIDYYLFSKVTPNPISILIDKTADIFKKEDCDYLIGIGGGSSIDFAKAVAIRASHQENIWNYVYLDYRDANEITDSTYPVIAVPTTSGTGSEVTKWAVVTNSKTHEKSFLGSEYIVPKVAIIDPELTITLPKILTAGTGIDALSHAIESYINVDSNSYSELFAKEAINIVARYLPEAVANGNNLLAREKMSWASTLSGLAITHVGTTLIHCMGHVLSGRLNLDHGLTLAVCLEPVMKNSWTSDIEKFARITELLGEDIQNLTLKEAAEASSKAVKNLIKQVELDYKLSDLGVKKDMITSLVDDVFKYTKGMLDVHPKIFEKQEVEELFNSIL